MSDLNSFSQFMEFHKDNSRYVIEFLSVLARMNRTYYDHLLSLGFNEEQSLELLKHHGFKLPMQ